VLVVASPAHRRHAPTTEIETGRPVAPYEIPARADAIVSTLTGDTEFAIVEPIPHGIGPIAAVHDADYLSFLEQAWTEWAMAQPAARQAVPDSFPNAALRDGMGIAPVPTGAVARLSYYGMDTATAIVEGTYVAARAAADAALTATDAVLNGDRAAYAVCRPPGHHAPRAAFAGYCFLNNAAVAVQHAVSAGVDRVAVVDVDYHHGNGTQQIFYQRGDVFYGSLHADPNRAYPYFTGFPDETGSGRGVGTTLNVPLALGCNDGAYATALVRILDAVDRFDPELIVVSLGVDAYRADPLSDLDVCATAFHPAGRAIATLDRPTVIVQEGGYVVDAIGVLVASFLRGLACLSDTPAAAQLDDTGRR
jgi:acetoin utilization deacetylase AcuC-like enzyme